MPSDLTLSLLDRYGNNVVIRSLIQLVPLGIGSAIDTALGMQLSQIQIERAIRFFDRLHENGLALTDKELKQEDFLHCFIVTVDAALKSRRLEKVDLLADLLNGGVRSGYISGADEYEEVLDVLDDLSYRELAALSIIQTVEAQTPHDADQPEYYWVRQCKEKAAPMMEQRLGLVPDEVDPFLRRLGRSGLLSRVSMGKAETAGEHGISSYIITLDEERVKLSPLYYRMREVLEAGSPQD